MSSTGLQSALEQKFLSTTLYKRSKQYFDINRVNQLEQKQEVFRRVPRQKSIESIEGKVEGSFFSTQTKINERVQTELQFSHKKCFREDKDDVDTLYSINERKGKTLDMSKMLSREYFEKERILGNESHFCNFQPYQAPSNHTIDFAKFIVPANGNKQRKKAKSCFKCNKKNKSSENQEGKQLDSEELGKIHQKLLFDESIFKPLCDYKKYDKEKPDKKDQKKELDVHLERIYRAQELTHKKAKGSLVEFYNGTNKWDSSQMENRLTKQNEQFLKFYNKQNDKKRDWAIIRRKTDLINKRRMDIMGRKHIKDVKGEICDQIYFRRNNI